jgi:hypothetical protein
VVSAFQALSPLALVVSAQGRDPAHRRVSGLDWLLEGMAATVNPRRQRGAQS